MFGRKADNLRIMKDAGINVPDFTVVSYDAYAADPDGFSYELPSDSGLYSVRSSCNLEDGDDTSFAGQFDTFLCVRSGEVRERIKDAFACASKESVSSYAKAKGVSPDDIRMNVIIQDMIEADMSGVIFTANPLGILNESVITVGRGSGEGVVSSRTDTTSYFYNNTDKLYFYEGEEDLLTPGKVEELIALSHKIQELIGEYADIEFSVRDDVICILQARLITTIDASHPLVMDNSNIVESYPNISLPLTCSFVDLVYGGVFRGLSSRVLKNDRELMKHEDVFMNMTGHVNGRIYYKISNWYTVLKFLPFNRKIIPVWQEMLGIREKNYDNSVVRLDPVTRIRTYFNSIHELHRVPENMKDLNERFIKINDAFYARYSDDMTPAELIGVFNDIKKELFGIWDVTLLNDMYTFIYTGLVKSRLKKRYGYTDKEINSYISGISDIESMKPVIEITKLAMGEDDEEAKAEYIRRYGDRNLEELKLESRTFRSNPELLDERIRSYREDPDRLAKTYESFMTPKKPEERKDAVTESFIRKCSLGIYNREISRLNRSRIYGIVRLIFDRLGRYYTDSSYIADPFDIYWLTVDEALSLAAEGSDMRDAVSARKERYRLFEELPAYTRLIFADHESDRSCVKVGSYIRRQSGNELTGVACSGGKVTGEALVISGIRDTYDVRDKILITKMTDPGWVFLLTSAKGVISEKGSLLSHTAIISREIGIPSIVGVKGLTDTVRTGDIVTMDGDTGKIEIVKRRDA